MARQSTSKRVVESGGNLVCALMVWGEREIVAMIPAVYDKLHKNEWRKNA
jgi:hypothetical protein